MNRQISSLLMFVFLVASLSSCKKDTAIKATPGPPVTDIDGNVYETEQIGTQLWMKQNLKTAHYRDGSAITEIEDSAAWVNIYFANATTPAWCYYNGDSSNNAIYGKLYDWYAVADTRNICPMGYHIATDSDWIILSNYLGGNKVAGGHLKSTSNLWTSPNIGADNSSGFTALPGGFRIAGSGNFEELGITSAFWTSTPSNFDAFGCSLTSPIPGWQGGPFSTTMGYSVRCVRD